MLPCANHGGDVVEDGDGDKGFRVCSVDSAARVGTGEDQQGCSERDKTPAIGAYVIELEVCPILVLVSHDAGWNYCLPVGFRCDSTGGRNPKDASENQQLRSKLVSQKRTADNHQRVPNAAESSRAIPERIAPTVSMKELSEALISISLSKVSGELPCVYLHCGALGIAHNFVRCKCHLVCSYLCCCCMMMRNDAKLRKSSRLPIALLICVFLLKW